ncbi:MAG: hypothetical protein P1U46_00175 [Patescibacteria group bacterium]|nr:hypothetical protein [Patescibacteria group bacterium]
MKNSKVRIFGLYDMSIKEFLAVSIHEFSHFYDLYILEKKVIKDTSEYFYDISWLNTNTIKKTISESDFVS